MLELSVECGHAHTCMQPRPGSRRSWCFRGGVLSLKCATAEAALLERLPIFSFLAGLGCVRAFLLLTGRFADCLSEPCACLAQSFSLLCFLPHLEKGLACWFGGVGQAEPAFLS